MTQKYSYRYTRESGHRQRGATTTSGYQAYSLYGAGESGTTTGPVYDPATYAPGQRATLVRQHVLGGGSSGAVVTGDTYVEVSGGIITTQAGSTAGGSVFGGGYAGPLSIQGNVVTGNADTLIEGGKIGTNIYAGAAGLSRVNGTATVTLKDIAPGDPFATDFTRQILRGGIGTGGTAHTVFDHQTAPFLGTVGTADNGQMDSIRFVDDTRRTWTRPASTAGTGSSRTARPSTWSPPAR
ncbi:hypothetical protein ACFW2M_07450 [Streptomyces albidoflavus]